MSIQTFRKEDSIDLHIGLDDAARLKVSKKVSGLLSSTYLLYLKTLYYHWNVTGPQFIGLHKLFEEQYEDLHKAGDSLAERVRALGHFTPGTVNEFLSMSTVKDDSKLPSSAEEMVKNLLQANEACSREARDVMNAAQEAHDEVTADMMIHRMTQHDKAAWFLRSTLQ